MSETAMPFSIQSYEGYWLGGMEGDKPTWTERPRALKFDLIDDAVDLLVRFQPDLWDMDGASVRPWHVAEGYRAVIEHCSHCAGSGRCAEDNPYRLSKGVIERRCMSCWGYGEVAIVGLSTVQLSWGGLFDGKPASPNIHLVRSALAGGCPKPLLCGIDFRGPDGPGYSVGGGCSGPGWENTPCPACVAAARKEFQGIPVFGSVGGEDMAAQVGVAQRSTWDFRRLWRDDLMRVTRNRPRPKRVPAVAQERGDES